MSQKPPEKLLHLVMWRAAGVAVPVLLVALALGVTRMARDVQEEVDAAAGLAQVMARLGDLTAGAAAQPADGQQALQALVALQQDRPLRHLRLQVQDAQGRSLLPPPAEAAPAGPVWWWPWSPGEADAPQVVRWQVPGPGGERWTLQLTTSQDAERLEALGSLAESLGLLTLAMVCLLGVLRWNLGRSLAPLSRLVESIAGIESQDHRSVQALPTMPVQELERLAAALRHLGGALDHAEAGRATLRRQVLTLQEDERARLARELHDEFGQRLTAMRADVAWLGRRLAACQQTGAAPDAGVLAPVVAGLEGQCRVIHQDIRALLTRLQPFGAEGRTGPDGEGPEGEALPRLAGLLQRLVEGWSGPARDQAFRCELVLRWLPRPDQAGSDWPCDPAQPLLPRALALALYRITQEALTNVARHAQAGQACVTVRLHGPLVAGEAFRLDWSVEDDGLGLRHGVQEASQRGIGLAGLRERVWALGGTLVLGPACEPPASRPGLRLATVLSSRWLPAVHGAG